MVTVGAIGGHPTYLSVGKGSGFEFWRDDAKNLRLLRELLEASLCGGFRSGPSVGSLVRDGVRGE